MKPEDIGKIKFGDYLELRHKLDEGLCFGRVIHISDPDLIYLDRKVIWVQVHPVFDLEHKITWDYEYLTKYVFRVIDQPTEKRMIKLLYDC